MAHTPGPWTYRKANFDADYGILAENDQALIAEAYEIIREGERITDNVEDNARLIAAAPDLLAACEFAVKELDNMTTEQFAFGADKAVRDRLMEAIAKARGEA